MLTVVAKIQHPTGEIEQLCWRAQLEDYQTHYTYDVEKAQKYLDSKWGDQTKKVLDVCIIWISAMPTYVCR